MVKFKKTALKNFPSVRKAITDAFKEIGTVKHVFRMNPSSWAVSTVEEDVPKFLAAKNLGEAFKDKPFTPKLLPVISDQQRAEKKRQGQIRNRESKRAKLEAERTSFSKDLVDDLRRQLDETKKERDSARHKNTELKVAMKETDFEVRLLKFRVEKAEGKAFEYGELEKAVLKKE